MTFEEAKKILIIEYPSRLGINPIKIRVYDFWYSSPFRTESNPSFKVDSDVKRYFFDKPLLTLR